MSAPRPPPCRDLGPKPWIFTPLRCTSLFNLQGEPPGHEQDAGQGGLHYDEESHLCHAGIRTPEQRNDSPQQPQRQLAKLVLTPEIAGSSEIPKRV